MTRNLVTTSPDTSLIDCAKILIKKRVGAVMLVENKKLRGILNERDIVWALTNHL